MSGPLAGGDDLPGDDVGADGNLYDDADDYPDEPIADPAPEATAIPAAAAPDGGLLYPTVVAFVEEHLAKVYARDLATPTLRWCSRWWAHAEALDRLDACWRAWENLRKDKTTGPSTWWREHADPAMRELLAETGPFTACSRGHQTRHPIPPLPTETPDPRLFPSAHEQS